MLKDSLRLAVSMALAYVIIEVIKTFAAITIVMLLGGNTSEES